MVDIDKAQERTLAQMCELRADVQVIGFRARAADPVRSAWMEGVLKRFEFRLPLGLPALRIGQLAVLNNDSPARPTRLISRWDCRKSRFSKHGPLHPPHARLHTIADMALLEQVGHAMDKLSGSATPCVRRR